MVLLVGLEAWFEVYLSRSNRYRLTCNYVFYNSFKRICFSSQGAFPQMLLGFFEDEVAAFDC